MPFEAAVNGARGSRSPCCAIALLLLFLLLLLFYYC